MSVIDGKVQFDQKMKRRRIALVILTGVEVTLTVAFALFLAVSKLFSPSSEAAVGVIHQLSYQGRLTDTSGNALGGSGTNYCMRFAIYDNATSGSKLWPSGTPATTTVSVVNGVFNAAVGSADSLTYNFYDSDTTYLDVAVNTVTSTCTGSYESLSPRQRILATAYAITSQNVYGNQLKTISSTNLVQLGTGAGVASSSVIKLGLDVANNGEDRYTACSPNGTIWYNSSASNTQTLICEDGIIRGVVSEILSGYFGPYFAGEHLAAQIGQKSIFFQPMEVPAPFKYDRFVLPVNYSAASNSSFSATLSLYVGLYTRTGNTLSLASSALGTYPVTNSGTVGNYSLIAGKRNYPVSWTNTVPAGKYFLAIMSNTTTGGGAGMSWSNFVASNANTALSGNFSVPANASNQFILGLGSYSVTSGSLPNSVAFSELRGSAAVNLRPPLYYFISST